MFVGVTVGVAVGVLVGVSVGVTVGVTVGDAVGVDVGVSVGVAVGLLVAVLVGVIVAVRVGKSDYYFFIMPDGYWYNAMLGSNMYTIDKQNGLIPIVTTNPTMRTQYTALEKQMDSLHQSKGKFWEKYGGWVS